MAKVKKYHIEVSEKGAKKVNNLYDWMKENNKSP